MAEGQAAGAALHIEGHDLAAISRLWRELAEFPAGRTDEARTHCFTRLSEIIGAVNVFWVASERGPQPKAANDLLKGWRPRAVARMHTFPGMDRRIADIVREMDASVVDPMTLANNAYRGRLRAFLRPELVEDAVWERSALFNEVLRPSQVGDRIIGTQPLAEDRESFIGLDRGPKDRPFGARERDLLHLFLMGAPSFHREQFLAHGAAQPQLTPRERQVLALLLTDMHERQIGAELGLTWRSTHQYAVSICRKLGVRGRFGLMALWLRNPPAT